MHEPSSQLAALAEEGLLRRLRPLEGTGGPIVMRQGRSLHNFASNDYLGLANHPVLNEAFIEGIRRYGSGAAASRLVCGTLPPHVALEEKLAAAKHSEAALVFTAGFATAIGTIPAVAGKHDVVVLDKLCHASLIDAAKLSEATLRVFPHNDPVKLRKLLASLRGNYAKSRILVVTESIFSMDGDVCPLAEIVDACEAHDALLLLDEAHAFGVLGPTGMGLAEQLGLQSRVAFQMGTFSKAAGIAGGYLAASRDWIDLLINRARSFIYSTAPPPAQAHATAAALDLIRSPDGGDSRERLQRNAAPLRGFSPVPDSSSAIIPVIVGDSETALAKSAVFEELGFLIPAIRYPTVPRRTARLRISVSAAHEVETTRTLAGLLGDELGGRKDASRG